MRVLFIDQYSEPGGAQLCLLDAARGAIARGWKAHAALPGDGAIAGMLRESGAGVSPIRSGPFQSGRKSAADALRFAAQLPLLTRQISRLLDAYSPDVVYVNGPRPLPAACLAARRGRVIFHAHSLLSPRDASLVTGCLALPADVRVIAGSRFVARPLTGRLPYGAVRVIYNGVPACCAGRREPRTATIGVIGRIAPEKGQLEFVESARLLASEGIRFVICGEPLFSGGAYGQRVHDAARGLPVEFIGWRQDVRDVLAALDLLVVPSTGVESTTRVILEAFSAGVPVLAFETGGIPEVVDDNRTGFLVRDRTPAALASAIRDLLGSRREEARAASRRARAEWERRFSVSRFQEQVLEAIGEMAQVPEPALHS